MNYHQGLGDEELLSKKSLTFNTAVYIAVLVEGGVD